MKEQFSPGQKASGQRIFKACIQFHLIADSTYEVALATHTHEAKIQLYTCTFTSLLIVYMNPPPPNIHKVEVQRSYNSIQFHLIADSNYEVDPAHMRQAEIQLHASNSALLPIVWTRPHPKHTHVSREFFV